MESILRAAAVYLFLLVVFRLSGPRALAQITTFDLVLLLIISEAIQQALIGNDNSMTNAALIVPFRTQKAHERRRLAVVTSPGCTKV